ncbi:MAG TPA: AraC family transcriptional regulator [Polyangia bacterium]|nr:AraC family transcriptional regulator [Polyangia bacterium]
MSEIVAESVETTAAFGPMRLFMYPPHVGDQTGVTLSIVEPMPPADGKSFAMDSHGLALHLGRPLSVRQRREDMWRSWTFTRGDLTLLPARWRTTMWTEAPAHFMAINLGPELVRRAAGQSGREVEMPNLFSFEDPLCRDLLLSMVAEAEAHGAAARLYVESAAVVVAQRLVLRGVGRVTPRPRPGLPTAVLRRAKEFLHDRMNRNPGITELSAAVGMSVDHFSRMFKRSTGLAPHQYLCDIRLEHAKRLLAEGRTPIIDVAYEIGYANPSQFSAFFRKRTGLSPSAYRRTTLAA